MSGTAGSSGEIGVLNARDSVLAMLYAGGGVVRGKDRLLIGLYIVSSDVKSVRVPRVEYTGKGLVSPKVEEALKELEAEGLITSRLEESPDAGTITVYELTEKGRGEAVKSWEKIDDLPEASRIKLRFEFASKAPIQLVYTLFWGGYAPRPAPPRPA